MQRHILTVLFAVFLTTSFFFQPTPAHACSCSTPSPKEAIQQSAAIFSGKVIQVQETSDWHEWIPLSNKRVRGGFGVVLDVQSTWKGIDQTQVLIFTEGWELGCGVPFEVGKEYLVYASYWERDVLETHTCSRTAELIHATDDLLTLGPGNPPSQSVEIVWTQKLVPYSVLALLTLAVIAAIWLACRKKRGRS
ncbi:hypothetical protein [uncultured Brevibacillus sp.]|uniref:hypothetical protein n=1 Tax=uncultured Brevibacillus sp. TaxID=169970 RepID=UPI002595756B|nr:hypothetical protein [uncultured Brevibacillus sp.]